MGSKSRSVIIAVLIGLLVLVVILVVALRGSGVAISQSYQVPNYFGSAVAYGTNSVVFSNNQSLESYDYAAGQLRTISPSGIGITDSLAVSPSKQFFLFHDVQVPPASTLGGILTKQGLDPSAPFGYWWVYNSQNQLFQVLSQSTLLAKFDTNNSVDDLQSVSGGEAITTYSAISLTQISSIPVLGSSNFFPLDGGFVLQSPDNQVIFTKDGIVNNTLAQSTVIAGGFNNKALAVGVATLNGSQKLVEIDLKSGSTKVVATGVGSKATWLYPDSILYTKSSTVAGTSQLYVYDFSTNKNMKWTLSKNVSISGLGLSALVGPSAAIVNSSLGNYYLIGSHLAPIGSNSL